MKGIKEISLARALDYCFIAELPQEDDKKNVWVRAIAEVLKRDCTHSYVYVEKDPETLENIIKNDFGNTVQIVSVEKYYPFCFLDGNYLPVFKYDGGVKKDESKAKKERVSYLSINDGKKDYSQMSLKELDLEVLKRAVKKQLNVEKKSEYAKRHPEEF